MKRVIPLLLVLLYASTAPANAVKSTEATSDGTHLEGQRSSSTNKHVPDIKPGSKLHKLLNEYYAEVWRRVVQNWTLPAGLSSVEDDLQAEIIVKINQKGYVLDRWFRTKSGNDQFDASVLSAILRTNPFPPLPDGYAEPYHEIGFRFAASELKGRKVFK